MIRLLARRLVTSALAAGAASLLVFLLIRLIPGDPVTRWLGDGADPRAARALRHALGLDRSVASQLVHLLADLVHGRLGRSLARPDVTVSALVRRALPPTAELALAAIVLALAIALPIGLFSALRPGGRVDALGRAVALAGTAVPLAALGPLLLLLFYVRLHWLPGPADDPSTLAALALPAIALGTHLAPVLVGVTRSALLAALGEDFARTARAKGLDQRAVIVRHALRNALVPIVAVASVQLGALLSGAIVTERVFGRPGLGTLLLDAIAARDYPVVQGCVLVIALLYALVTLLSDLLGAWLDPRVRL